jgi:GNAT superfamily N-acetyltransferase
VNSPLALRLLTCADLGFADAVRAAAGWNQTLNDWLRFLETEPEGCFLAEWDGAPAGTATTTVYGPSLAWIGMVLVAPAFRRRGIGRALLGHCLDYLEGRGVRCVKLDATPVGKTVYDQLGFRDEWTLQRWARLPAPNKPLAPDPGIRPWCEPDASLVQEVDTLAFGVSRERILRVLARQSTAALVLESAPGRVAGYGLLRPGAQALYLGPVAAISPEAGLCLLEALLAGCDGQQVYWDIPDPNLAAVALARRHGFIAQRPLVRMHRGENNNHAPGDACRQFALAGPEIG